MNDRDMSCTLVAPAAGRVRFVPTASQGACDLQVFVPGDILAVVANGHGDLPLVAPGSGFLVRELVEPEQWVERGTPLLRVSIVRVESLETSSPRTKEHE